MKIPKNPENSGKSSGTFKKSAKVAQNIANLFPSSVGLNNMSVQI
jgi:hypothetical protein